MSKNKFLSFLLWGTFSASIFIYYLSVSFKYPINSDDAAMPYLFDTVLRYGKNYSFNGDLSIFRLINFIAYTICGLSDYSVYLACSFTITLISGLSLILVTRDYSNKTELLSRLFTYVYISVLVSPKATYYWRYHSTAVIITLLMIILLNYFTKNRDRNKYILLSFLLFMLVWLAFLPKDFIFVCIAIVPIIFSLFIQYMKGSNRKVTIYPIIIIIIATGIGIVSYSLFTRNTDNSLTSAAYFGTSFIFLENLGRNLNIYITGVLELFGANIQGQPMFSLSTLCSLIKILFILYGYYKCFSYCFYAIFRKDKNIEFIDQTLSFSIVILSIVFIVSDTTFSSVHTRYINSSIPFLGIIISRALYKDIARISFKGVELKRFLIITLICCCLSSIQPVKLKPSASEYSDLADVLLENNLIYGMAPFWTANSTNIISHGQLELKSVIIGNLFSEYFVGQVPEYLENLSPNFIVAAASEGEYGQDGGYDEAYVRQVLGKPIQTHNSENHIIMVYDYDISVKPLYKSASEFINADNCIIEADQAVIFENGTVTYNYVSDDVGYFCLKIYGENLSGMSYEITNQNSKIASEVSYITENGIECCIIKFYITCQKARNFNVTLTNEKIDNINIISSFLTRINNRTELFYDGKDITYVNHVLVDKKVNLSANLNYEGKKLIYLHGNNIGTCEINIMVNDTAIQFDKKYDSENLLILETDCIVNGKLDIEVTNNSFKEIIVDEAFISIDDS